jgi:ferredoxin
MDNDMIFVEQRLIASGILSSSPSGACGGELACSTCHLIFEQAIYDSLPEKEEEEDDMLDLAFEVTET